METIWLEYPDSKERKVKSDIKEIEKIIASSGDNITKVEYFGTGKRIKERIEIKFNTQEAFLKKFNENPDYSLSQRNLTRWISEETNPSKKNLLRTAELLNCDIEYLKCEQDTPRKSKGEKIRFSATYNKLQIDLNHIEKLLSTTANEFQWTLEYERDGVEIYEGDFISGDYKYYYVYTQDQYTDEYYYEVKIENDDWLRVSEENLKELVDRIQRYILFEIKQLK